MFTFLKLTNTFPPQILKQKKLTACLNSHIFIQYCFCPLFLWSTTQIQVFHWCLPSELSSYCTAFPFFLREEEFLTPLISYYGFWFSLQSKYVFTDTDLNIMLYKEQCCYSEYQYGYDSALGMRQQVIKIVLIFSITA